MKTPKQFREYPFFSGLSDAELGSIAASLSKRTPGKGVYLYHPGKPAENVYLVESGLIRMFYTNAPGEEFVLNLTGPGEMVGAPLMPGNQVCIVGASALQSTVVLKIGNQE